MNVICRSFHVSRPGGWKEVKQIRNPGSSIAASLFMSHALSLSKAVRSRRQWIRFRGFSASTGAFLLITPSAYFAERDQDQSGKREYQQRYGDIAVKLGDFAVEQRQSEEDKKDMGAEDFERRLAQGKERLNCDQLEHRFAQPIQNDRKRRQIDEAERADAPLVENNDAPLCKP